WVSFREFRSFLGILSGFPPTSGYLRGQPPGWEKLAEGRRGAARLDSWGEACRKSPCRRCLQTISFGLGSLAHRLPRQGSPWQSMARPGLDKADAHPWANFPVFYPRMGITLRFLPAGGFHRKLATLYSGVVAFVDGTS